MADTKPDCELIAEPPIYVSAKSANSLISFSHPTRIQALTLYYLNKTLDELLLHILHSARSLATDRIKSDGILRVLGGRHGSGSGAGAQLAKNAVLEAELELRNHLDGQRKDGKIPLGLSTTSRYDGTEQFPVANAYKALRERCQYYSALGELDPSTSEAPAEQTLMSADGRPLATVTTGVSIYVASLLEYVAEHILQNVALIMERDNSDEASPTDLAKALEENEGFSFWWSSFSTKDEMYREPELALNARDRMKVKKPWQVPSQSDLSKAAGHRRHGRHSIGSFPSTFDSPPTASSSAFASSQGLPAHTGSPSAEESNGEFGPSRGAETLQSQTLPRLKRRSSFERAARFFSGIRPESFRASQVFTPETMFPPTSSNNNGLTDGSQISPETETDGNFESVVMSGQTMKVSLTPNRLLSMTMQTGVDKDDNDDIVLPTSKPAKRRPGTTDTLALVHDSVIARSKSPNGSQTPVRRDHEIEMPALDTRGSKVDGNKVRTPRSSRPPEDVSKAQPGATPKEALAEFDAKILSATEVKQVPKSPRSPRSKHFGSFFSGASKGDARGVAHQSPPSWESHESAQSRPDKHGSDARPMSPSKRTPFGSATQRMVGLLTRRSSMQGNGKSLGSLKGVDMSLKQQADSMTTSQDTASQASLFSINEMLTQDSNGPTASRNGASVSRSEIEAKTNTSPAASNHEQYSKSGEHVATFDASREVEIGHSHNGSPKDAKYPAKADSISRPSTSADLYSQMDMERSSSMLSSTSNAGKIAPEARKTSWSYTRQGSMAERRKSVPGRNARRFQSYSSGTSQQSESHDNAPPSAWLSNPQTLEISNMPQSADYITPSSTPRQMMSPSLSGRQQSPSPLGSGPSKTDVARILAHLKNRIKDVTSVEECQRLVLKALALTAAAVHDDTGHMTPSFPIAESPEPSTSTTNAVGDIPDENVSRRESSVKSVDAATETSAEVQRGDASTTPKNLPLLEHEAQPLQRSDTLPRPVRYGNLALPMAVGYEPSEDDSLPSFHRAGAVAAWLLAGDDEGMHDLSDDEENQMQNSGSDTTWVDTPADESFPTVAMEDGIRSTKHSVESSDTMDERFIPGGPPNRALAL